jgi:hypothetical protein
MLGYPDIYTAADHVPEVLQFKPLGLEGIDDLLIDGMKKKKMHPEDLELLPPGGGWLLVEFVGRDKGGSRRQSTGNDRGLEVQTQSAFDPSVRCSI